MMRSDTSNRYLLSVKDARSSQGSISPILTALFVLFTPDRPRGLSAGSKQGRSAPSTSRNSNSDVGSASQPDGRPRIRWPGSCEPKQERVPRAVDSKGTACVVSGYLGSERFSHTLRARQPRFLRNNARRPKQTTCCKRVKFCDPSPQKSILLRKNTRVAMRKGTLGHEAGDARFLRSTETGTRPAVTGPNEHMGNVEIGATYSALGAATPNRPIFAHGKTRLQATTTCVRQAREEYPDWRTSGPWKSGPGPIRTRWSSITHVGTVTAFWHNTLSPSRFQRGGGPLH
jgi:hypothetical protein